MFHLQWSSYFWHGRKWWNTRCTYIYTGWKYIFFFFPSTKPNTNSLNENPSKGEKYIEEADLNISQINPNWGRKWRKCDWISRAHLTNAIRFVETRNPPIRLANKWSHLHYFPPSFRFKLRHLSLCWNPISPPSGGSSLFKSLWLNSFL